MNLLNQSTSYILLSSPRLEGMTSVLYSRVYQILPLDVYYKGKYGKSILAFGNIDNESIREDAVFLLNTFGENNAIVKYIGESKARKIERNGSELFMDLIEYNTDHDKISYIYEGFSFSFIESKRYWKPSRKEDLKIGMMVEYFNNNKWNEKKILNPNIEYDNFYKLLIKYDKVRIPILTS